jgi:YD repeat-containing protein
MKWFTGQLKQFTNPAGHITTFDEYELNGKVKKMTDANGVITTMTYHSRDWLTGIAVTSSGVTRTTGYEYWATGKLKKMTQPDGSFLSYSYDPAQRLTGIADSSGNSVLYTLDNAGNKTKEEFKDSGGSLKRNIARAFDTLSRAQTVTGAGQ